MRLWARKAVRWLAAALAVGLTSAMPAGAAERAEPSAPAPGFFGSHASAAHPPAAVRPGTVIPADFEAPAPASGSSGGQRGSSPPGVQNGSPPSASGSQATSLPPLSAPGASKPLPPLARPTGRRPSRGTGQSFGPASWIAWAAGLAVVLGLFLLVAWVLRRAAPAAFTPLPREVIEVLGRTTLATHQHMHLVRCGNKLLLLSLTPSGTQTLTEITDPDEVTRLTGLCRQSQPGSTSQMFRQVFEQFARGRRSGGRHA